MKQFPVVIPFILFSCLLVGTGCEREKPDLQLRDLTETETRYLTRIVVLERAKAVALADGEAGTALLDSLAAAWGGDGLAETLAGAPAAPRRSAQVHRLLVRILKAEQDSLMEAPRPDRLSAPLPDPAPDPDDPAPAGG